MVPTVKWKFSAILTANLLRKHASFEKRFRLHTGAESIALQRKSTEDAASSVKVTKIEKSSRLEHKLVNKWSMYELICCALNNNGKEKIENDQ